MSSLRARLAALERALSLDVPAFEVRWAPEDGLYELPDGDGRKVDWDTYVQWHIERGYPRPIRLGWPEAKREEWAKNE